MLTPSFFFLWSTLVILHMCKNRRISKYSELLIQASGHNRHLAGLRYTPTNYSDTNHETQSIDP